MKFFIKGTPIRGNTQLEEDQVRVYIERSKGVYIECAEGRFRGSLRRTCRKKF